MRKRWRVSWGKKVSVGEKVKWEQERKRIKSMGTMKKPMGTTMRRSEGKRKR